MDPVSVSNNAPTRTLQTDSAPAESFTYSARCVELKYGQRPACVDLVVILTKIPSGRQCPGGIP